MSTRFFGAPVKRNEDRKLLTGQALFIDDVELPGMLHVAFLRSQVAHARLKHIDVSRARKRPGVVAVYVAEDYGDYWQPCPLLVQPPPIPGSTFNPRTQVPLARDKVRYVGEPLAVVVAESRYLAEDALDDIDVELESLSAVVDIERALKSSSARVHDDLGSNIAAHVHQMKGDYRKAAANAQIIVKRRFRYEHGISSPIETRGVVAHWNARGQQMTIWDTTQAPVFIRNGLAAMLGLGERQVRVIAPFVGGGFGPKIMMFYPEEVALPWISMRLNRPVKWIEDRLEHFVATTHERGQIHDAEIALAADGRILGVKDVFLHDTGAYNTYGLTVPINSQCTMLGPYVIPAYDSTFTAVFTNLPIVTPYRGAGRQHGVFVIERLLDLAARELDIDRAEIRRRNLIPPDAFPYNNEIIFQDFAPLSYDSGNYEPVLAKALDAIGYQRFLKEEQPKFREEGRCVGIGIACYVEGTGIGPYEGAKVQVQANGKVNVATGIGTQGQGHFTSFAQIVADQLGIDPSDVDIVTGDTDQFYWGAGTFASRGAVVAGNAVNEASAAVRRKALKLASDAFECAEEDLVLADGKVSIAGIPGKFIRLGELAQRANPMRGAVRPGTEPGLESTQYFGPPSGATANGVHAAIVEIDPLTFELKVLRYVVVHDCGTVINPMILEGQIHGGVAQGIGNAFFEKLAFDDQGQLLNASLADYLLPTALDVPRMELDHTVTPSPLNPLGIKGAGEAGAIPVGAVFAQAIEDALQLTSRKIELLEIPLSPSRLFELTRQEGT
ncbi:xanthine dehydrogenase family protein molybdopterin-binding subunit [Bradyrhizobium sp. WYCCWR 13023]|uniref:Xanthine dehydrogenase family protein molybdopterin-binding subunit n=1 Tax=Bradyrhizobium zhengyangense TaxID=2911009 RepID=A0A9X1RL12_9BRAD|nr:MULTISPECIES: xanthine dehydrogenase family protein molybdopterin-binding subunit [Bradyrhizobium]MCG2632170.1 xanthine dehydrogenase family protein molybdopterin-binding subunit [Bradyrhizobium zhengyangense]MCG2672939.1 xanthine dehydrogenase family protein molybdopterin-binding subunit [Bradyrhizobium zhengyangense]MDA9521930.1 xanthine dehydrogenase [Bradyrhizobium sp. CCBAU 11434]